ncbi:MAG: substrate-binding domain-containing protein [Atopobiaceae bacterium]|nr:substrate-binding domain-containing protein [Atopobiaceae bacterium]
MGFDDTSFSRFSVPRVTTIRQGPERLEERAAQILLGMLDGGEAVDEVIP